MITARIEEQALASPDAVSVIDGATVLTRHEVTTRARALSRWLSESAGVRAGDAVAAALPNGWEYAVIFLAVNALGARFLPVNPQWRSREVEALAARLDVRAAFLTPRTAPEWAGARVATMLVDEGSSQWLAVMRGGAPPTDFGLAPGEPGRIALLLTTSGSSGRPKIVPRTNANLLAGAHAAGEALRAAPGRRYLCVVPFHHANGFANCLLLPLLSGGVCVMARNALPSSLAAVVRAGGVQVVNMSPFLYSLLSDEAVEPEAFSTVDTFLSTGAPLPRAVARRWRERFGRPVRQLYGSSETGTIAVQMETDPDIEGIAGQPLNGVQVRILGGDGEPLPAGAPGEVAVRGPAMMRGYVGDAALNASAFKDGFFRTGDTGRLTAAGAIVLEGRSKRWVNLGGVKVDPVEVENALYEMPAVLHCHVTESRDERGLAVLAASIQLRPGAAASRRDITAHCRRRLAEYKIPRVIEFAGSLAQDATGKIRKEESHA